MQVIMYVRSKYNSDSIQKISSALKSTWPLETLDLVMIFDTSSSLLCEAPTMVRIFIPQNNRNNISMSSLTSPIKSSHYDAMRLFQHFENNQKSQLIFIEKSRDAMEVGSKIVKQLLKTCSNLLPSRREIPKPLQYLEESFTIFYQTKSELYADRKPTDNVISLNSNRRFSEKMAYPSTRTSVC